jgi:class 3 adenylate cyclase/pimeloyl-ACP methyl ester carboxylesterase
MSDLEIRYARSGDIDIAYAIVGDGPRDLVWVSGAMTNLRVMWELPEYRRFCERLASFSRLILFDKRGMGLSDRVEVGTLEERMDDVRAVMDAAGSEHASLMGVSEGGPMSILFAATHPERTDALLLAGAEVKEETTDDWPWGEGTRDEFDASMTQIYNRWGKGGIVDYMWPTRAGDARLIEWGGRLQVEAMTPRTAEKFMRMAFEIDVRDVVPTVNVPTLIVHRTGDGVCHVENARYLAKHVRGARYVELPGIDHIPWGEDGGEDVIAEVREFVTGVREAAEPDRVLATVLFTDVVGSTQQATELGDRRWRDLLELHHERIRKELERFRGRELDTAGDGFLASFDGPVRAIRCARAAQDSVRDLGLQLRAGVHTGECEMLEGKLSGIAVHIGARVASKAQADEVLVSGTVHDLVAGSGIEFEDRGTAELKGVPGEWRLFAVSNAAP